MYPIFKKLFKTDEAGWKFLKNAGFSTSRICNLKKRGFSHFAKELLWSEACRKKIQVQPNDFYKQ